MQFIIGTATRYNEGAFAEWAEIENDEKLWTIPGAQMRRELTRNGLFSLPDGSPNRYSNSSRTSILELEGNENMPQTFDKDDLPDHTNQIVAGYQSGELDRRAALRRLMLLGISASTAYALIGELSEPVSAEDFPAVDPAIVSKQFEKLEKIVTSKAVIDLLKELRSASNAADRTRITEAFARRAGDAEFFRKEFGVGPTVEDLTRFSMRVFEEKEPSKSITTVVVRNSGSPTQKPTVCASFGVGLCVSYGWD